MTVESKCEYNPLAKLDFLAKHFGKTIVKAGLII
jgi:hypothetical protein